METIDIEASKGESYLALNREWINTIIWEKAQDWKLDFDLILAKSVKKALEEEPLSSFKFGTAEFKRWFENIVHVECTFYVNNPTRYRQVLAKFEEDKKILQVNSSTVRDTVQSAKTPKTIACDTCKKSKNTKEFCKLKNGECSTTCKDCKKLSKLPKVFNFNKRDGEVMLELLEADLIATKDKLKKLKHLISKVKNA